MSDNACYGQLRIVYKVAAMVQCPFSQNDG
jgi:hypothetical protein